MSGASSVAEVRSIPRITSPFDVEITLPGSKSIALRQLLISSLTDEQTTLRGIPRCDDVEVMFDALVRLGFEVRRHEKTAYILPPVPPSSTPRGEIELDLGMSGVSLRFLIARSLLRTDVTHITGHEQLHARPNADLLDALERIGCTVRSKDGFLPISIQGPEHPEPETTLRTNVTSQYLSALLLTAPAMPEGLTVHLRDVQPSRSYVGITATEMARRGIDIEIGDDRVIVPPGRYRGGEFVIEGDASGATYHAALATLHGGRVRFTNLGDDTRQGDYAFLTLCERMGARVARGANEVTIEGPSVLQGLGEVDMVDMPDAAQTVMALAPFLPSSTHLTGLATLRVKECDRIGCTAAELRKCGIEVEEFAEAMTIHPVSPDALSPPSRAKGAVFDTYQDHRMAMALSVLASRVGNSAIRDPGCVAKTYADYWGDFERYFVGLQ